MHNSKLLQLIRSLSQEELRWLAKLVRSPYFNSNKEITNLFDYIRKYSPDYTSSKLRKELVFGKLFPKEPYNDRRMRVLMFRLSDLVEKFMVIQGLKQDGFQYQKLLLQELKARKLDEQAEKKQEKLSGELRELPYRDEYYYERQWQLLRVSNFRGSGSRYKVASGSLSEAMKNLDLFYLISKLRYSNELYNRQNILSEEYDIIGLKEVRDLVTSYPEFMEQKALQIYNDVLLLMEDPLDTLTYDRLEKKFISNLELFRKSEQASLLKYLINCTFQLNSHGKIAYLEHQLRLFKLGLDKELFLENGRLLESTFLNIVITGTVLREVDWVEKFIEGYAHMMENNSLNLAWAYWHFAKLDFLRSNTILLKVISTDIGYNLRIKSLSLRNYFELFLKDQSYYDLFEASAGAFEKFLHRNNRITSNRARAYLNFIAFLKKLGKLLFGNILIDKKILARLQRELEQTQPIIARRWLIEKLET